jgi:hypothetical protein
MIYDEITIFPRYSYFDYLSAYYRSQQMQNGTYAHAYMENGMIHEYAKIFSKICPRRVILTP